MRHGTEGVNFKMLIDLQDRCMTVNLVQCKADHPQYWSKLYTHTMLKDVELLEIILFLKTLCYVRKKNYSLTV